MNTKQSTYAALLVLAAMVNTYLAQVSSVSDAVIVTWSLHDWARASLFCVAAGIAAWKAVLLQIDPNLPKS